MPTDSSDTPRQARADDTRRRIIETARELFRDRGYEAVSTAEVLRRAEISRGGLYHHFGGKDELLLAVFEDIERELMTRLAEGAAEAKSPFDAMRLSAQTYLDQCLEWDDLRRISLLYARRLLSWEVWREMTLRHGLGLAVEVTRQAMAAGELKGDDPEAVAQLFVAMLIEGGTMIVFADDGEAERRRIGAVVDALLVGLRAT